MRVIIGIIIGIYLCLVLTGHRSLWGDMLSIFDYIFGERTEQVSGGNFQRL